MLFQLNLFVFRCLGLVCGFVCRWRSSIGGFAVFRGNPAIPSETAICMYKGDCISLSEAKKRDEGYNKDPSVGSYMYYRQDQW